MPFTLLRSFGVFAMLTMLSTLLGAQTSTDAFPRLSDNTAGSATLEVRKVLHGQVDGLFVVPRTRQVVAAAGGYLWKFSEHGVLQDTLYARGSLFTSGVMFTPDHFVDWVFTGSAQRKAYGATVDGNAMSHAEVVAALGQAEVVEFGKTDGSKGGQTAWAYLWASGQADRSLVNQLVTQADLVKFSRDELEYLAQGQTEAYIQHCLAQGCQLLLVTDGAKTIEYFTQTSSGLITPPKVQAVDTTAGGDAFIGGFLYALSGQSDLAGLFHQQKTLEQLLHFAAHCGAYAVTQPGAFTALPDLAAVKARLTAQGHELHEFPSSLFIGA